jgi:hypothetical protein
MQSAMVDADLSIQSAIMYGLDQSIYNVVQQGAFNCPTGNCTWDPFESLAICNKCTDLALDLQRIESDGTQAWYLSKNNSTYSALLTYPFHNSGTAFRLPSGLYIDNTDGFRPYSFKENTGYGAVMLATLGTANASQTTSPPELDTLIWSMSMIRADSNNSNDSASWPHVPLSAMECTLYYCVKSYKILVSDGILREVVSKQVTNITRARDSWEVEEGYASLMNESQKNGIAFDKILSALPRSDLTLVSPVSDDRFNISSDAVNSISNHFQSIFASEVHKINISETPPMTGRLSGYYMKSSQLEYEPSIMQALFSSKDLNATFEALAASMSNALRTGADGSFDGIPITVAGMRGDITTFYRILWPWICLHYLNVIVGAVFLGITICENRRYGRIVPLWKSSSLAIATHGDVVTDTLSGMQTVEEMWKKAAVSKVIFSDKNGIASSSQELLHLDCLENTS